MIKKILVTGGSGFIGSAITKYLVSCGHKVTVFDNNSRGRIRRLKNIKNKINFYKGDIRDFKKLNSIPGKFDCVVHLAYVNGTKHFYKKPFEILDIAVGGLLNVLKICKAKNVNSFYLASSSEVYQNPYKFPTDEKEMLKIPDIHNPRYSYGGGKILTELVGLHYGKKFFKKLIIFRPHNVYGADMGQEHVIPELIKKIRKLKSNNKLVIQGSGNETRSFIHIDDFVRALRILIKKGKHLNIYNIGTNEEVRIKYVAKTLLKILKKDNLIKTSKLKQGGTIRRCPDISKIKKFGFKPKIDLIKGLKLILDEKK